MSGSQFVAILFCQLGRADSLRDICNGLACSLGRLVHLGIAKAPSLSTLFPWAQFRRAKGGVKAYVLPDHGDYLPAYVLLTEAVSRLP